MVYILLKMTTVRYMCQKQNIIARSISQGP